MEGLAHTRSGSPTVTPTTEQHQRSAAAAREDLSSDDAASNLRRLHREAHRLRSEVYRLVVVGAFVVVVIIIIIITLVFVVIVILVILVVVSDFLSLGHLDLRAAREAAAIPLLSISVTASRLARIPVASAMLAFPSTLVSN